jgi:hypothetical protein
LACHHSACTAPLVPAGGAAPASDDLNVANSMVVLLRIDQPQ